MLSRTHAHTQRCLSHALFHTRTRTALPLTCSLSHTHTHSFSSHMLSFTHAHTQLCLKVFCLIDLTVGTHTIDLTVRTHNIDSTVRTHERMHDTHTHHHAKKPPHTLDLSFPLSLTRHVLASSGYFAMCGVASSVRSHGWQTFVCVLVDVSVYVSIYV